MERSEVNSDMRQQMAAASKAAWPVYLSVVEELLDHYLSAYTESPKPLVHNGQWHWTTGVAFVCMIPNDDLTVKFLWGVDDEIYDPYSISASDVMFEQLEMSVESLRNEDFQHIVDWLAHDRLDADGYPEYAAGYIPIIKR